MKIRHVVDYLQQLLRAACRWKLEAGSLKAVVPAAFAGQHHTAISILMDLCGEADKAAAGRTAEAGVGVSVYVCACP